MPRDDSSLSVLRANEATERQRWLDVWYAWPQREVHAHPCYVELFCRASEEPIALHLATPRGGILVPLILRPLSAEPWAGAEETARDLSSPYGYGGPYAWGDGGSHADAFWNQVHSWATSANVVTWFARLSVFSNQRLELVQPTHATMKNVVRDLRPSLDGIWQDYSRKVRKNVRRAQKEGLRVEVDTEGERLDEFLEVYYGTMERRGARSQYYFSRDFFQTICSKLQGSFAFFHAVLDKSVVSTELILTSASHGYSFLGGTRSDTFAMRPNDLLKHEAIAWLQAQGLTAFVLGGGYGEEDGIFRYKQAFAPSGIVDFEVGHVVFDKKATKGLCQRRHDYERGLGQDWQPDPRFFPPYRAPSSDDSSP